MVKAHRVLRTRGAGPWRYHAAHPTFTSHHAEGADRQDRPARPSSDHPPPQGKGPDVAGRSRLPERDAAAAVQQGPRVRVG